MGALAFLNDRYVEVELGPAPNVAVISFNENVTTSEGKTYHTGRYENDKWVQGVDIELEIKGGNDPKPDDAIVRIYNMNLIKNLYGKDSPIIVKAGYLGNYGVVFSGLVKSMSTKVQGQDTVTTFRCDDKRDFFLKAKVNDTWPAYTKWTTIVREILTRYTNLPIGYIHLDDRCTPERYYITTEKTIKGWLKDIKKKLQVTHKEYQPSPSLAEPAGDKAVVDVDWDFFIRQGRFYFLPENVAMPTGLYFTASTGLLSVVQGRDKDGKVSESKFIVTTMFDWRVTKQSVIKVLRFGNTEPEFFKVTDFKFISNSKDHDLEIQVKQLKDASDTLEINEPMEFEEVRDVEEEEDY